MDGTTNRNILQRQAVASFDRSIFAAGDGLTDLHTLGCQDVVISTVRFLDAGNARAAVRIVFDMLDSGGHTFGQLEVHNAVKLLRAAALVAGSDTALVVAAVATAFRRQ